MPVSTLSFSLIQTSLFWEDKGANLDMLAKKILSIEEYTEVIVLPEMFNTGFSMQPKKFAETMDGPTVEWMRRLSAEKKAIITGSLMIQEGEQFFNRLIWMLPNGELGYYDKRHLFAFAGEDQHYAAGNKRLIASVKGWKINLQVCYDLRFPVWARQQGEEYDVLLYVANWPEKRISHWKTLLTARAIENQCCVLGVNRVGEDGKGLIYSGESRFIDGIGTEISLSKDKEMVQIVTLKNKELTEIRKTLPFLKDR